VIPEDIKALAPDVLRHRVIPTYEAEARDISSDRLIQSILEAVEVP
jgi:MoxR-like ATPase